MTTATNIQTATNQATLNMANGNMKEAIEITNENTIQGFGSVVSEALRTNRATTLIAGILMGGMIAAAAMLPGNASADTPARPVGDTPAASVEASIYDMDLLDPGFYDSKLVRTSELGSAFDMDLIDPGFYDAKVIRSGTSAAGFDMDLLDPGFYNAIVVRTSRVWESPGFDPYEDVAAKVIRSGTSAAGYDMDLFDPGVYDAKAVRSGTSAAGFDMDLLDPGIYNATVVRTSRVWESPGFDPYEDMEAVVARIAPEGDII